MNNLETLHFMYRTVLSFYQELPKLDEIDYVAIAMGSEKRGAQTPDNKHANRAKRLTLTKMIKIS